MPRSTYVYVLYWLDGDLVAPFTVKKEMERWVSGTGNPAEYWAYRHRDGHSDGRSKIMVFDDHGKAHYELS